MLRIRRIEEAIADQYGSQEMRCPTHLSIGQEAPAVSVCMHLNKEDKVYSSHRAHAHYLAKNGSLNRLIAELHGKSTGCTGGRGGSMHLTDLEAGFVASTAIVGNSIPIGVGGALHQQLRGLSEVSVIFFGDGAVEEGAFYESVNFAAVKKLPTVFVCENNRYSVYSSLESRQPKDRKIHELARSIGVNSHYFDGEQLESNIPKIKGLIDSVRLGGGPVFFEFPTYRFREHCGPNIDDQLGYRSEKEVEAALEADPLRRIKERLKSEVNPDYFAQVKGEIDKEIVEAFEFASASITPNPRDNNIYTYG